MKFFLKVFYAFSFLLFLLIAFSSAVNLYEHRSKIKSFITGLVKEDSKYKTNDKDLYWANKIMEGGYILHFRHTERDKWIDYQMYDAIESDLHQNGHNKSRYAENDYFAKAVCLNERGKIQAKVMGESIKHIGLPIGNVISSVSCRARQTAELAFGGYQKTEKILVHRGPYYEDEKEGLEKLKKFYENIEVEKGKNTIISSHNGVIDCQMFVNNTCPSQLSFDQLRLEEGGFYILSKTDKGLMFEYEFHNFNSFNKFFYKR